MIKVSNSNKGSFLKNQEVLRVLKEFYFNLNMSIFEWQGLPTTCSPFYLEKALYEQGKACMLKYNDLYLSLKFAQGGEYNVYGECTKATALGFGFSKYDSVFIPQTGEYAPIVPIFDTVAHITFSEKIEILVEKLAELYRIQDVIIFQSKRPYIIGCEESQLLNVTNLLKEIDINKPAVVGFNSIDDIKLNMIELPNRLLDLDNIYKEMLNIDNQIRRTLGINSIETEKKERLVTNEVDANNEVTNLILDSRLKSRKEFCKHLKTNFGLEVDVIINEKVMSYNNYFDDNTTFIE